MSSFFDSDLNLSIVVRRFPFICFFSFGNSKNVARSQIWWMRWLKHDYGFIFGQKITNKHWWVTWCLTLNVHFSIFNLTNKGHLTSYKITKGWASPWYISRKKILQTTQVCVILLLRHNLIWHFSLYSGWFFLSSSHVSRWNESEFVYT